MKRKIADANGEIALVNDAGEVAAGARRSRRFTVHWPMRLKYLKTVRMRKLKRPEGRAPAAPQNPLWNSG